MLILAYKKDGTATAIDEVDDESTINAIRIFKKMRWAKVRRRGRKGNRYWELKHRNSQEHKHGVVVVDNAVVKYCP